MTHTTFVLFAYIWDNWCNKEVLLQLGALLDTKSTFPIKTTPHLRPTRVFLILTSGWLPYDDWLMHWISFFWCWEHKMYKSVTLKKTTDYSIQHSYDMVLTSYIPIYQACYIWNMYQRHYLKCCSAFILWNEYSAFIYSAVTKKVQKNANANSVILNK